MIVSVLIGPLKMIVLVPTGAAATSSITSEHMPSCGSLGVISFVRNRAGWPQNWKRLAVVPSLAVAEHVNSWDTASMEHVGTRDLSDLIWLFESKNSGVSENPWSPVFAGE